MTSALPGGCVQGTGGEGGGGWRAAGAASRRRAPLCVGRESVPGASRPWERGGAAAWRGDTVVPAAAAAVRPHRFAPPLGRQCVLPAAPLGRLCVLPTNTVTAVPRTTTVATGAAAVAVFSGDSVVARPAVTACGAGLAGREEVRRAPPRPRGIVTPPRSAAVAAHVWPRPWRGAHPVSPHSLSTSSCAPHPCLPLLHPPHDYASVSPSTPQPPWPSSQGVKRAVDCRGPYFSALGPDLERTNGPQSLRLRLCSCENSTAQGPVECSNGTVESNLNAAHLGKRGAFSHLSPAHHCAAPLHPPPPRTRPAPSTTLHRHALLYLTPPRLAAPTRRPPRPSHCSIQQLRFPPSPPPAPAHLHPCHGRICPPRGHRLWLPPR